MLLKNEPVRRCVGRLAAIEFIGAGAVALHILAVAAIRKLKHIGAL